MNIRLAVEDNVYRVRLLCDYCRRPIETTQSAHCVWDMDNEAEDWGAPLFVMHAGCDRYLRQEPA